MSEGGREEGRERGRETTYRLSEWARARVRKGDREKVGKKENLYTH